MRGQLGSGLEVSVRNWVRYQRKKATGSCIVIADSHIYIQLSHLHYAHQMPDNTRVDQIFYTYPITLLSYLYTERTL